MTSTRQWSLGAKLALLGTPFLLLVLLSTIATLWISWQLDGGAAAVNEAGRMRPSSYYDRIVDVMEELVKFTLLTRDLSGFLTDRYSERKESAEDFRAVEKPSTYSY